MVFVATNCKHMHRANNTEEFILMLVTQLSIGQSLLLLEGVMKECVAFACINLRK
jgi:hypothetical protein